MISDNQRRFICRIFFLLICVAPTSIVCYWICHPQTSSQWQREIQSQLGVATTIDSIETPGPYVTILRGVKLSDPELGSMFDAMEVRIEFGKTNIVKIPQKVRLTNAGLIQLVQTINEHLIRAHAADRPWQIYFLDQTIIEESIVAEPSRNQFPASLLAENLQIDVEPMIDGTVSKIQFQLPDIDDEKWIYCALSRSRVDTNQRSQQRLELNTNELELPCWILGDLVPEIRSLGQDCRFAGRVDLNPRAGNPYGWFNGEFTHVEAGVSHSELAPGQNYSAKVELCKLDGGIESLKAYLVRPDGTASPIQETLAVVEQFDVVRAIRTAAESNSYLRAADIKLR